jgi:AraC-like DNA-binding protein
VQDDRDALVELLLSRLEEQAQPKSALAYLRVRRYIEEHYLKLHTVREVASACKINRMYLSRLFRRYAGTGAYQFITWLKMRRAAELLCEDGVTVKQVAERLAFADPFHFSRVFKRVHGIAPDRFARRYRASIVSLAGAPSDVVTLARSNAQRDS